MNKVWVRKLEQLALQEKELAVAFQRQVDSASRWYEVERKKLDNRRAELDLMRDDPVVVVRQWNAGPKPIVYHAASGRCGWRPDDGERLLESEAKARGLKLCRSWDCSRELRGSTAA